MSTNKTTIKPADMAQFRFAIIAPVIQELYPDDSRTAYYKRIAEKPLRYPDGSLRNISYKTVVKSGYPSTSVAVSKHFSQTNALTKVLPAHSPMLPSKRSSGSSRNSPG